MSAQAPPDAPPGGEAAADEELPRLPERRERPEVDRFVREVMRAQVAAALFGATPAPVRMGRYELRRELGTGGGGSVFEGWDPELEREVAIKLVQAAAPALRARALAEGQALAKLAHPNVVPVFDVGAVEDRVYLVMELVRGKSLRVYAQGRRGKEILAAYRQCCEGLAAAHAAKLVHRDFKPDNAVVGTDGRVRIIDFGLAVEDHAHQGIRGGTPRYMAPEQQRGEMLSAATDQYAFAVSLREALGQVPAWLERVLARAEQERPSDRYPSMRELATALSRDPATLWRRRALVALPVVAAAAAFWAGQRQPALEICPMTLEALGEGYSLARQAEVRRHLGEMAQPYAASAGPQLLFGLDVYAGRWLASHRRGCVAHRRGELSAELYERQQRCLSGARTKLATLTELLARASSAELPELANTLPELSDPERCADPGALANVDPPAQAQAAAAAAADERLARLAVLVQARSPAVAAPLVEEVAAMRRLGYRPLLAQALLLQGTHALQSGEYRDAAAPLAEATEVALATRAYELGVEAFARHAWISANTEASREQAFAGVPQLAALAAGLPVSGRFAEALLHNNLGSMHLRYDRPDLARVALRRSIELSTAVTGPGAIELSNALSNLALVTEEEPARQALFDQKLAFLRTKLGEQHPSTLQAAISRAVESGPPAAAREDLQRLCPLVTTLHPELRTMQRNCWLDLAWLELAADEPARARLAFARGIEADSTNSWARLAAAWLALLEGRPEAATAQLAEIAAPEVRPTTPWHELYLEGSKQIVASELARQSGARAVARRHLLSAERDLSAALQKHLSRAALRRLQWVKQQLAELPERATGPD